MNFEDGCYQPIFGRVMPLKGFYSFPDFFSLSLQIFIWYLVHCRYRSSSSLVLIHWFFTKLWPLDLEKNHELSVLHAFFLIFIWYLIHCFVIPRYRSSLSLVLIHWFFTKLWPLDLEKNQELLVFRTFFSLCLQIFIWYLVHCFAILSCRSSSSLVFYPFEIYEVMAHGLRKTLQIVSWLCRLLDS
jgi:hypothetical protein